MRMASVTIIPSLQRVRLIELLPAKDASAHPSVERLQCACIKSVCVDTEQKACKLKIVAWHPVESQLIEFVKHGITKRFPEFRAVEIEVEARELIDLETWIDNQWQEAMRELTAIMPAANGWLTPSRCLVESGRLVVEVENQAAVEHLKERRIGRLISNLILLHTGNTVEISLRAGDFTEEREAMETRQEEELRKYLGELLNDSGPKKGSVRAQESGDSAGSAILLGRDISADPMRISDLVAEEQNAVIEGRIFAIESRPLKSGKTLTTFCISDGSDSIQVKVFEDKEKNLAGLLEDDDWLLIEGAIRYDQFSRELVMMARNIVRGEAPTVTDDAPRKRVELHLHTKMSAMDSVVNCSDAIKLAAQWGHPAIAITDHGVVQSFPEAFRAGSRAGIKVIYGMEGYLADSGDRPQRETAADNEEHNGYYHIVILVKDQPGLKNLYRLVSKAHLEHFYKKPRILRDELISHREGLLLGSACEAGELFQAILAGESHDRLKEIASFYDYLEIQPIGNNSFMLESGQVGSREELEDINRRILELGRELGKPVVATGDVHFLRPEDSIFRAVLMAGQKYEDADNQAPLYLRTTEEMLREFAYLGEQDAEYVVIDAPNQIADMISSDIRPLPEGLHSPHIEGADEAIRQLCLSNAQRIYGNPLPDIVEQRLSRELTAIIEHGYAVNYWIAHQVVAKSLEAGYQVGSRGSVGSSLVATMCSISEVNPLPPHYVCPKCKYSEFILDGSVGTGFDLPSKDCPECGHSLNKDGVDIPFETFMGFEGDKVPDIDLNFADVYLEAIHRYTEEMFGSDRIYRAGTVATIAEKTAYGFVKAYAEERGKVLRSAEVNRLVRGLTGVKRSTGQHPGGLLVVPEGYDICDFCPVQYPADNTESRVVTSHFSYHDSGIDECLTKLDLLGKVDPTTLRMLQDITGLSPEDIPLDDPDTMAIFSGVETLGLNPDDLGFDIGTLGIPEFNTPFLRQILADTRPTTFDELIKIMGLSHGKDVWLNNAQDLLAQGLASSLSEVICCRDDIMLVLIQKGMDKAHAFSVMEKVRKGRPLSAEDEEAMRAVGAPEWYLESCKKISYLFPKAHAAAYVIMAFRLAYFKVHYPHAFYAAYFSTRCNCFDAEVTLAEPELVRQRIRDIRSRSDEVSARERLLADELEVVLEAKLRGVDFLPVDLDRSEPRQFVIEGDKLRMPFVVIPGLGLAAAESVVSARGDRPFTSREDLRSRTKLTKTIIDLMGSMGILKHLPETDQLSLFG